jgi:hypothetical protein
VRRLGGGDLLDADPVDHMPGGDEYAIPDVEGRADSFATRGIHDGNEGYSSRGPHISFVESDLFGHQGAFEGARGIDCSGSRTCISTRRPAVAAMFTRASSPNRSTFPRVRSEIRGCVTPNILAACA